jgi:8-oxo-dGTP diphosphatase
VQFTASACKALTGIRRFNCEVAEIITRRQLANTLKRVPRLNYVAQRLYRLLQESVSVGCVGAVFNASGKVLLVEHVFHPLHPWGLPGGWMNRGEEPALTVARELKEETGLTVTLIRPLIVCRTEYLPRHLDIAYLCRVGPEVQDTDVRLSDELLDYTWAEPNRLPSLSGFHRDVIQLALAELVRC